MAFWVKNNILASQFFFFFLEDVFICTIYQGPAVEIKNNFTLNPKINN